MKYWLKQARNRCTDRYNESGKFRLVTLLVVVVLSLVGITPMLFLSDHSPYSVGFVLIWDLAITFLFVYLTTGYTEEYMK